MLKACYLLLVFGNGTLRRYRAYFSTRHNGNESATITTIDLKLVLEERGQLLLSLKGLAHRIGECSSGCLTKETQMYNLVLALEDPHFIEQRLQGFDFPVVNNLLQFLRCDSRAVKVSVE